MQKEKQQLTKVLAIAGQDVVAIGGRLPFGLLLGAGG